MRLDIKLKGVEAVLRNLERAGKQNEKGVARGLKKAGLLLQRESQKIVPIDTAQLKNSAFTRAEGRGSETVVRVGYTANYAIFVHEDLEAQHAPGKTAKYLERPMREKRREMLDQVRKEASK